MDSFLQKYTKTSKTQNTRHFFSHFDRGLRDYGTLELLYSLDGIMFFNANCANPAKI